jgi:hypothetical protein
MPSQFAGLAANISEPFRMTIINPLSDDVLRDSEGQEAYVEFMSADSEAGRKIDRLQSLQAVRKLRSGRNLMDEEDLTEAQIDKLVALTVAWYLVDLDGRAIDVPYSVENARELWRAAELAWLRRQAWVFVNTAGNFIKRPPKTS